ncbi:processed acidic surface protein [Bacillaceae bacterium S4-13-58]
MKRMGLAFLLFVVLVGIPQIVGAEPPQDQLNQFLAETGMSVEELQDYLSFFETSLAEISTMEELYGFTGTPINDENFNELLATYNMTGDDFYQLFSEYDDDPSTYQFIEDLELAVAFYGEHEGEMDALEYELADIGMLKEEINAVLSHLSSLDEEELEEKMKALESRVQPYLEVKDPISLSEAEQNELFSIMEQTISLMQLNPAFYLVSNGERSQISYTDLIQMETIDDQALYVQLFDGQGNQLADMELSAEMLGSDYILQAGENLLDIGDMAGELTTELHEKKLPNTASPYLNYALLALLLIAAGIFLLRKNEA